MKRLGRLVPVGALALGLLVVGAPADAGCPEPGQGAPGCHSGPVPAEWGEPTWEHVTFVVVARQKGYLPGRLGNQHLTEVNTWDEEGVVAGTVRDWFCPAGAVPPLDPQEASPCRLRATSSIDYDHSYVWPGETVQRWAPTLRYVNVRLPVVVTAADADAGGAGPQRGWLSLRLKADGAVTQSWYDGDHADAVERAGAYVSGGRLLGKPWLATESVTVDTYVLHREYDPAG